MKNTIKNKFLAIALVLFLAGCARLEAIDKKLGEMFFSDNAIIVDRSVSEEINPQNLTKEQRTRIDAWLGEKGFNRFGDLPGTYYASGTPLFDAAGQAIERYEYILSKYPELGKIGW